MSDASATGATTRRFDVFSADGAPLAVWVDGEGPALVLVHGSPSEHTTFDSLVQELRSDLTTFAMDRRGSGASGDVAPYAIEREFEDVAAVVDAVAARTGGPVALFGHSYGCNPAMGGATLTTNVHHLVLYEPSFGLSYPAGSIEAIEQAVAAGDREAAIRAAFVGTGVMTDEELEALRAPTRSGAGRGDAGSCGGHSERLRPRARRAWPLRLQDRSRHGRRNHTKLHLVVIRAPGVQGTRQPPHSELDTDREQASHRPMLRGQTGARPAARNILSRLSCCHP